MTDRSRDTHSPPPLPPATDAAARSGATVRPRVCEDIYIYINMYICIYIYIYFPTSSLERRFQQYAGRPDWNRIGKGLSEAYPNSEIGVFLCGPAAIGKQLVRPSLGKELHAREEPAKYHDQTCTVARAACPVSHMMLRG